MQKLPDFSRAKIQALIELELVTVNERKVVDCSYSVKAKDKICLQMPASINKPLKVEPEKNVEFKILFEDEDIMVVDKPAGIVVHPGAGNYEHTLVNGLVYHCGESLSNINTELRPGIVHRIDKDTSGILVVAKNDFAHMQLAKQFEVHSIQRKYICFVYGVVRPLNGKVEGLISRDRKNRLKMSVSNYSGKRAVTLYKTLQVFDNFASKVECELKTGRTHQIRVHLSSLGNSLIGDRLYKVKNYFLPKEKMEQINSFPRQALHAYLLEFIHPTTGKSLCFESPLPEDMLQLEKILSEKEKI